MAIPFFFVLMAVEGWLGHRDGQPVFRGTDVVTNLALGTLQVLFNVVAAGLLSGIYALGYEHRLWTIPSTPWLWLFAIIGLDFCYYWFHRASHRIMVVWALHAPHHSSEDYNLSVALRQGPLQPLVSRWFYLPMGFLGVPPSMYVTIISLNTLFQFWIHTEQIGCLGWLEQVFNTPSHHRVHHGCNPAYVDKNHAGAFIVWDRWFGTFAPEDSRPVYGTVVPAATWNPLRATWIPIADMIAKVHAARGWHEHLMAVFGPPEWLPASTRRMPEVVLRAPYNDRPSPLRWRYGALQSVLTLAAAVSVLLLAARWPSAQVWVTVLWVVASFGVVGAVLDNRRWAWPAEAARWVAAVPLLWWLMPLH
jgi:alkylglycerol monooxygenase